MDSKKNKELALKNVKQNQLVNSKKTNNDTDSDDVFVPVYINNLCRKIKKINLYILIVFT